MERFNVVSRWPAHGSVPYRVGRAAAGRLVGVLAIDLVGNGDRPPVGHAQRLAGSRRSGGAADSRRPRNGGRVAADHWGGDSVALHQFVRRWVRPELVIGLHLGVVEEAGADEQRGQYLSCHRIRHQCILLVVLAAVLHHVIHNVGQLLGEQRHANPKVADHHFSTGRCRATRSAVVHTGTVCRLDLEGHSSPGQAVTARWGSSVTITKASCSLSSLRGLLFDLLVWVAVLNLRHLF